MAMDARKQRILEAIVALYANDGEPVGSGLLANYFDMALSSATLRNEMAALTKLGLLEQPHTSAGRVPSAALTICSPPWMPSRKSSCPPRPAAWPI